MNLLAYRRVSTDRQADQGYGLDAQADALAAFAASHGHHIATTFTDAGVSGERDPAEREGFADLIAALTPDYGVLVPRLDRLARTLTVQEQALAAIWSTGAQVYAADIGLVAPDDPDDPTRALVRQVLGAVAQWERSAIGARMRAGRRVKRSRGGYAGDGPPPTGWRVEGGELVPDDREQAAVRRMHELRAMGLSLRAISESLEMEGHRPKRAGHWHGKVIADILRRTEEAVPA